MVQFELLPCPHAPPPPIPGNYLWLYDFLFLVVFFSTLGMDKEKEAISQTTELHNLICWLHLF